MNEAVAEAPPSEADQDNLCKIRFLCNKETSTAITGNGIDGDDHIIWDRRFKDQIEEARTKFYALIQRGYRAFYVKGDGSKGKAMLRFDPSADEALMVEFDANAKNVLMIPPIAAG